MPGGKLVMYKPKGPSKVISKKLTPISQLMNTRIVTSRGRKTSGGLYKGPFRNLVRNHIFKPQKFCKFKYTHSSLLQVGTAGIMGTEQVFRLNSLYDPDFTGTGHQAYFRDQLSGIYNNYTVYGAKIEIEVSDPSEDSLVVGMLLQPSDGSFTVSGKDADIIKERPGGVCVFLASTGNQYKRIKQYVPLHQLEGVTKSKILNDDLYSSAMGANPTQTPFLRVAVSNQRGAGSGTIMIRTTITYFTRLWGLLDQAQS